MPSPEEAQRMREFLQETGQIPLDEKKSQVDETKRALLKDTMDRIKKLEEKRGG
jgi:Arc/MetJ family transcription regulator